jgi:hypothetical protein
MTWYFVLKRPGTTTRNPIQGEFFAEEAIEEPAHALVREAIQNSLDARLDPKQPVRVRIYVSGHGGAIPAANVPSLFEGTWSHITAPRNGLRDQPSSHDHCPFVVIEDFNTKGLEGDPEQYAHDPDLPNPFFTFFRAEGLSDKSETDRGRWGVGKFVFPRSSRVSAFFGLTIRSSDKQALALGRMILKSHRAEGTDWEPDGYHGNRRQDGLVLPIEDKNEIQNICDLFRLSRMKESGLSVAIPYPDPTITFDAVTSAVGRNYYHAILRGDLVVNVECDTGSRELTSATILDAVKALPDDSRQSLEPMVSLSQWGMQQKTDDYVTVGTASSASPVWGRNVSSPETLSQIKNRLDEGRVAIRVPIRVTPKARDAADSFFDIYLERTEGEGRLRPAFVREGILVPDVGKRGVRRLRSIVVAEDRPIATFLGDAENPAHTRWLKDGTNFKGRYVNDAATLRYVTTSVEQIATLIELIDRKVDRKLLASFFSVVLPPTEEEARARKKKPVVTTPLPPLPPPKPARYHMQRVAGGFSITPGASGTSRPSQLVVRLGYTTRSGNPIRQWQAFDFDVADGRISIDAQGVSIVSREGNRITAQVTSDDFRLRVTGFDTKRDLTVDVKTPELAT